jgi:hypothetical protein
MPTEPDTSAPETFDEIVARLVAASRPRLKPGPAQVRNPAVAEPDMDRIEARGRLALVGFMASAFTPAFVLLPYLGMPLGLAVALAVLWAVVCFTVFVVPTFGREEDLLEPRWLEVPHAVAHAYRAYPRALARLRAGDADPDVVAAVAAQVPALDAMVMQMNHLHRAGRAEAPEGVALSETIVRLGAQAEALCVLDRRRQDLAHTAPGASDLLSAPVARLDEAARTVVDETRIIESTLVARSDA